jgi:hypothetical protein
MIFEILLVVLTVTYTFKEIVEIKIEKWDYFKSCWNYVDWANLIILYVVSVHSSVLCAWCSTIDKRTELVVEFGCETAMHF